ncbi:hypothetical protein F5Y01DRAFT_313185 [Xylaria sp. FL0043]|nr:hypothetical protein F5Y01DRAFT_313185 [Xylaria sp. FL0043]
MASSSETAGASPSGEATLSLTLSREQGPRVREWSQFELSTVCALMCKFEHEGISKGKTKKRSYAEESNARYLENRARDFATTLNGALHGSHNYKNDIRVSDVRELLDFIEIENKDVMAYIKRQPVPFRVTRAKKYAFQRLCNNFNDAFYRWVVVRRARYHNLKSIAEQALSLSRSQVVEHYLSSADKVPKLPLETAPIQKNTQPAESTERGWISNSVYARRSPVSSLANTASAPAQSTEAHLPRGYILPAASLHRAHHQNRRRAMSRPPPPPPYLSAPSSFSYGDIQSPYSRIGMEAEGYAHPSRHAYFDWDPSPTSTPLPPVSPAFSGHDNLRQSIHPMGPKSETPLPLYQAQSELEQIMQTMGQRSNALGQLTSPAHTNPHDAAINQSHQNPTLSQDNGASDDTGVFGPQSSLISYIYMDGCNWGNIDLHLWMWLGDTQKDSTGKEIFNWRAKSDEQQ